MNLSLLIYQITSSYSWPNNYPFKIPISLNDILTYLQIVPFMMERQSTKQNKNHTKNKQKKKRNNNNNSCLFHLGNSVLPEIHELIGTICQQWS